MAALLATPVAAQPVQAPYSLEEVKLLLASPIAQERVEQLVRYGCIEFALDAVAINELREAGATLALIGAIREACNQTDGAAARSSGPPPQPPAAATPPRREAVAGVAVTPARLLLEAGARASLAAQATTSSGALLTDRTVTWSIADDAVAAVTADGLVRGQEPGTTVVTAEADGVTGRAEVRVVPRRRSVGGALTAGLLFPGGGQFRVGRGFRGMLTIGAVGGAVAWGFLATETVQHCASPVSGGACPPDDVLFEETNRPNLTTAVAVGAAVMLLSAVDAALHGRRQNTEGDRIRAQPWGSVLPQLDVGPTGAVSASWRLDVR
jgi:hypothetical protein